jgi:hypothetical protein
MMRRLKYGESGQEGAAPCMIPRRGSIVDKHVELLADVLHNIPVAHDHPLSVRLQET